MAITVAASSRQTQPKDLRTRLGDFGATSPLGQIDPNRKEILAIIRRAKDAVGLSQKAMAIAAGVSESELSEALHGRANRRFDAEWLWRQDDLFLLKFVELLMDARALTPENAAAVRRQRIVQLVELLLQEVA